MLPWDMKLSDVVVGGSLLLPLLRWEILWDFSLLAIKRREFGLAPDPTIGLIASIRRLLAFPSSSE